MLKKLIYLIPFFLIGCNEKSDQFELYKKLGTTTFTSDKWKSSTQEEKAALFYSFLTSYDVYKLKREDVIELLGQPTAYFEYDEIPAYFIGPKSINSIFGNGYLIAFPYDRTTGLIKEVVIKPSLKN